MTYLSYLIIPLAWVWIFRTRPGLMLQGIGEKASSCICAWGECQPSPLSSTPSWVGPSWVWRVRFIPYRSRRDGKAPSRDWMVSVGSPWRSPIFGGWNPIRAALGVYLFAFLQWLGLVLQPSLPGVPSQVLQVAPFPLMIMTLLLVNIGNTEWVARTLAMLPAAIKAFLYATIASHACFITQRAWNPI